MISLIGILVIGVVVGLLVARKTIPIIGMVTIPVIGALLLGYNVKEINDFFLDGLDTVIPVAVMFIFAILFFGVMNDSGLFDPIVKGVINLTRGNIIMIAVSTVIVGGLAHLDGSGATTFLVTVPAFLHIYQRMGMSLNLLVMLVACSIGIVNLFPWGGPIARSATVMDTGVVDLWKPLMPFQMIGFILLLIFAAYLGWREKLKINKTRQRCLNIHSNISVQQATDELSSTKEKISKKLTFINWCIFLGVLILMLGNFLDPAFAFMIGLVFALLLNYKDANDQSEKIKEHAPNALMMASIILAAGVFLGIIEGTGMLKAIAQSIVTILPNSVIPKVHLIVGIFGLPLDLVTSTDAYYFSLLPIVDQIVSPFGVEPTSIVYALSIGNNFGAMISPLAPATWLGVGLAGISIGSHIRYSFFRMWIFSIILLIVAVLLGIVPLS